MSTIRWRIAGRGLTSTGSDQQRDYLRLAALPGMGERRDPLRVGATWVGAVGQQQAHDLGMPRSAVAEDHRLQQCRPAQDG